MLDYTKCYQVFNIQCDALFRLIKGLIDKFPPGSILRKLFNSKNVSYSYCVAKNMGHHIQGHNNRLLGRVTPP